MAKISLVPVDVQWVDATSSAGQWTTPETHFGLTVIMTRGWLVKQTKAFITVASSHACDSGQWGGEVSIPWGCVAALWIGGKRIKPRDFPR